MTTPPHFLTVRQTAALLHCSQDSVRRLLTSGQLRGSLSGTRVQISPADIRKAARPVEPRATVPASAGGRETRRTAQDWTNQYDK